MKIATSVLAAALLSATAAWAGDPGVSDTEIKIGDVNIMTGPAAFVGRGVSLGSKIAAGEINAAGGINGRKIKILTEDDGYIPSRSFQALTKLLEEDGIFALNGTSGTANVLAMMPLITENNLPTVVTTAPSALIYKPVRPSVFTFGASYSDAFYAQLKYIHDHSEPKNPVYGIIRQDDDFGQEVEAGYERAVKEFGVKDGIRLRFKKGSSNFAAEMAQMKQAGVNVLANGGIFAGAANILSEARKLDMDIQSADVWSEGIPASAKLAAPAGYDYLVGDYVALTGPAVEKFLAMAKQFTTPEELAGVSRYHLRHLRWLEEPGACDAGMRQGPDPRLHDREASSDQKSRHRRLERAGELRQSAAASRDRGRGLSAQRQGAEVPRVGGIQEVLRARCAYSKKAGSN
ncbi:MAG: ABC transporter substrate-binding protein [Xanthobacteraceae bacterium]